MTQGNQTPDAVREANAKELLAQAYERANLICPAADVRAGNKIDWVRENVALAAILAALDSHAGDAGEGVEACPDQEAKWASAKKRADLAVDDWQRECTDGRVSPHTDMMVRQFAYYAFGHMPEPYRTFIPSATPAPAVDAECPSSPDGRHQVDTSMESGPNNCFHCEAPMGGRHAQ